MATVKLYPGTITTVGTWTNPDNAKANNGTYAVIAGSRNNNLDIIGSAFSHSIPSGSTINSVTVEVEYKLSTTASAWTGTLQAQKDGTLSGTAATTTNEPTTDTIWTNDNTGAWSFGDLANLEVLFRVRQTSNTACNYSVDYLAVTVDYTEPSFNFSGSVADSNGIQQSASGKKAAASGAQSTDGIQQSMQGTKGSKATLGVTHGDQCSVIGSGATLIQRHGEVSITHGLQQLAATNKNGRSPPLTDSLGIQQNTAGRKSAKVQITDSIGDRITLIGGGQASINKSGTVTESAGITQTAAGRKSTAGQIGVTHGAQILVTGSAEAIISKTGAIAITAGITQSIDGLKTAYGMTEISQGINVEVTGSDQIGPAVQVTLTIKDRVAITSHGERIMQTQMKERRPITEVIEEWHSKEIP